MNLSETVRGVGTMKHLCGSGNHKGGAVGKITFAPSPAVPCEAPTNKKGDMGKGADHEQQRYSAARESCIEKLRRLYGELRRDSDSAWIFLMQITLLNDPLFTDLARLYISEGKSAERAVTLCREYFFDVLISSEGGEHLKKISVDVEDVTLRILCSLEGDRSCRKVDPLENEGEALILACERPVPSLIAERKKEIMGIISDATMADTSSFELASAFDIPTVLVESELSCSFLGKTALLDSDKGDVYIDPDLLTLARFDDVLKRKVSEEKKQNELANTETRTKDGRSVLLYCELSDMHGLDSAALRVSDGIGRLSSEDLYLESVSPPDEESLFERYRIAAEAMPTKPVMVRAFRAFGSVRLRSMITQGERGDEDHGELYVMHDATQRTQLRAVMRAAIYGSLSFVLPQGGGYSELSSCARMMEEISTELYEEDREYTPVPLGMLIDTVSAAVMCERLIGDCDFLVIDMEKIKEELLSSGRSADGYDGDDELASDAVHTLLCGIVKTSREAKKKVTLSLGKCGTHADVSFALEAGFSALSVDISRVVKTKRIISEI